MRVRHCAMCCKGRLLDNNSHCAECAARVNRMAEARGAPAEARRETRAPLVHLVPIELIEAVAEARVEGDCKYTPGNWQNGSPQFFVGCLNHAIEHLFGAACMNPKDQKGDSIETHLGHAACNIAFILWALKRGRVSPDDFFNAALPATPEADTC